MQQETNARIKGLCREISAAEDTGELRDLLQALRQTVESEGDEVRVLLWYLANYYRRRLESLRGDKHERPSRTSSSADGFLSVPSLQIENSNT